MEINIKSELFIKSFERFKWLMNSFKFLVDYEHFLPIYEKYTESHRYYHNIKHILHCFEVLDDFLDNSSKKLSLTDIQVLYISIFFHDLIYDPKNDNNDGLDNILQSANESSKFINNVPGHDKSKKDLIKSNVFELILLTDHKEKINKNKFSEEFVKLAEIFLDIDLSILGSPEHIYDDYRLNIGREYSWVPDYIFCERRLDILENLYNRERIFRTDYFHKKFEKQARENLDYEGEMLMRIWRDLGYGFFKVNPK